MNHASHSDYRPDIDGLRAVAVGSVLLFHAFPSLLPGGFIGVDVFFVISGFLISTILFNSLEQGRFNLADFYGRRVRRIFPALILVLVFCYAFGWFVLLADEYKQLGSTIAAGAGFSANFLLWAQTGYFDNAAETKPLLHLWSLGIEEQFYVFWPLLLALVHKRSWHFLPIAITLGLLSFGVNVYLIDRDPAAAFYSPLARVWELMIGSILAYLSLHRPHLISMHRELQAWAGIALLLTGFVLLDSKRAFPGWWALLPAWGGLLLLSAGPKAWFNRTVLNSKPMIWIGLISYPLYLWHWPLLSFARIHYGEEPPLEVRVATLIGSVVLATSTYLVIEKHVRSPEHQTLKACWLAILMCVVGFGGFHAYHSGGLQERMQARNDFIQYFESTYPDWSYFQRINLADEWRIECGFFDGRKYFAEGHLEGGTTNSRPVPSLAPKCYTRDLSMPRSVLLWGDSHAQALAPGLHDFMPNSWQVLQVTSSACPPSPDKNNPSTMSQCDQTNYFAMKTIQEAKPDVVVIAQSSIMSEDKIREFEQVLSQTGVPKVLFVGPVPHWTADLPKIIARQLWLTKPKRTRIGLNQDHLKANDRLRDQPFWSHEFQHVDVMSLLCNQDGCLTYLGDDIRDSLTTWDYGHLTPTASRYVAKNLLVRQITHEP